MKIKYFIEQLKSNYKHVLANFLTLLEKEALIELAVCIEAHEAFYYVKIISSGYD